MVVFMNEARWEKEQTGLGKVDLKRELTVGEVWRSDGFVKEWDSNVR